MTGMGMRTRSAIRIRPKSRFASDSGPHDLAVFTAIDGTLLDAATFDAGTNRDVIGRLVESGAPVVPVSVMTLAELIPVASELGLKDPMVVEGGGAIARWTGIDWDVEPCGPPVETLRDIIRDIETRSGASLLLYSSLSDDDAARLSGRTGEHLDASRRRQFSEPFLIERGDLQSVRRAAAEVGFSIRRGRRFLHLSRECDEGEAFSRLREELQCALTVGLGGASVDAEFLIRADIPIIIPGPDGRADAELLLRIPGARVAHAAAPAGWAAAAEEVLHVLHAKRSRARGA